MPENGIENTEEIIKRLLLNIEAFKRIERDNQRLQTILLKNEAIKRSQYSKKIIQEAVESKKREATTKDLAKQTIDKFRKANDVLGKEFALERKKNRYLAKKYLELSAIAKKLHYDNKIMKAFLTKNSLEKNRINQKMLEFTKKLEEKHEVMKLSYKGLIKENEITKMEMKKKLLIEGKKNEFLEKKYTGLVDAFDAAKNEYNRSRKMNHALIEKLSIMQRKSLANEKVLAARTEMIKVFFETKLKEMAKMHIDKEIDYKARIESMSQDLVKYYDELKQSKQKYFIREKEIKEKIKQIFD